MKVVFFGTPGFSVPFLQILDQDDSFEVAAVVTQTDKPVGRKKIITAPPIKNYAIENDIPVLQPTKIKNNKEFIDLIAGLNPDFLIVVAYGLLLPKELLDIPKYGSINVHTSLLPKYRGAAPVQSALLNGDKETGITIMRMNEELDAGDIYLVKKYKIEENDTTESLFIKLSQLGAIILPTSLKDIADEVLHPIPQDISKATFCSKLNTKASKIDPQQETAQHIYNKFKAYYPWPGIFINYKEKRLKILSTTLCDMAAKPGELKKLEGKLILGTKENSLELLEVQMEGKNKMSAKDFINGFLT